jgi:hypothetical protein
VPLLNSLAKIQAGAMRVLAQESELSLYYGKNTLNPRQNMTDAYLYFAVIPQTASFASISEWSKSSRQVLVFSNKRQANTLANSENYVICAGIQSYSISQTRRPVTLTLRNDKGEVIEEKVISKANKLSVYSFIMYQYDHGLYSISEKTTNKTQVTHLAYFQNIPPAAIAIVQINIAKSFYTSPASFNINFTARSETLNYYIVAANYDNTDIQALDMKDTGFNEQARSQILFNKLESARFTDQHIDANLLSQRNTKVVLFTSQSAVKRRQYSPKKIQLMLNNEVLISSLPIPGSNRVSADFFIHVAKI